MTGPDAYDEIDQMPLTDVLNRHQVLSDRDSMARAIAAQQARGRGQGRRGRGSGRA